MFAVVSIALFFLLLIMLWATGLNTNANVDVLVSPLIFMSGQKFTIFLITSNFCAGTVTVHDFTEEAVISKLIVYNCPLMGTQLDALICPTVPPRGVHVWSDTCTT